MQPVDPTPLRRRENRSERLEPSAGQKATFEVSCESAAARRAARTWRWVGSGRSKPATAGSRKSPCGVEVVAVSEAVGGPSLDTRRREDLGELRGHIGMGARLLDRVKHLEAVLRRKIECAGLRPLAGLLHILQVSPFCTVTTISALPVGSLS